jgi:hypothetical protein
MATPKSVTIFSYLSFGGLPQRRLHRYALLFAEALVYALVGHFISRLIGLRESGVFSIFITAISLRSRFDLLLNENRDRIWSKVDTPWRVNRLTAMSLLSMFAGLVVAYVAVVAFLHKPGSIKLAYGFAMEVAGIGSSDITQRNFSGFLSLFRHNLFVLFSILLLSFLYRSYGALLALAWNACIWGLILTLLVQRGLPGTVGGAAKFIAISSVALLPHLLLEAVGYLLGSLAAIFLSKGLLKYEFRDARLRSVFRASGILALAALAFVLFGAFMESGYAPWLLSKL